MVVDVSNNACAYGGRAHAIAHRARVGRVGRGDARTRGVRAPAAPRRARLRDAAARAPRRPHICQLR